MLGARMALWGGRRSPLPPGARWVEYLESTGTQYIDTGVVSDGFGIRADVVCAQTAAGDEQAIVGRTLGDGFELYTNYYTSKTGLWCASGRYIELSKRLELSQVYTISAEITTSSISLDIDGSTTTRSNFYSGGIVSGNILVFTHRTYYFKGRVYSCKIWQNGVLVRDFRPIAIGTTGYMLDMVSGALFGNAGTGAFAYGGDLPLGTLAN